MNDDERKSVFMEWFERYGSTVMKVSRAYTLTREECQDLAQEILLNAWRSLPQFQNRSSLQTWFYRVALQTAMTWQRNDKLRRSRQNSLLAVESIPCDAVTGGEELQNRETVDRLYRAIHRLPKTDAALVLLYLDQLSYREMADVLDISESNVGVKLNRAKTALSQLMSEESHES